MIQIQPRRSEIEETERLIAYAAICPSVAEPSDKDRGLMIKQILRNQVLIMRALGVGLTVDAVDPVSRVTTT